MALLLTLAAPVAAQDRPDVFTTWLEAQRTLLAEVEHITVRVTSDTELVSGPTTRRVAAANELRLDRGRAPQRTLLSLTLDGEPIHPQRSAQIERQLDDLGGPAVSRLAERSMLPIMILDQVRLAPREAMETTREGQFVVVRGRMEGQLPGAGPPRRNRPPGRVGAPLPRGRRGAPELGPPRHEITLWFEEETRQLAVMEHRIVMERGRGLTIRTEMARVDGLDVPLRRTVRGEVRSPRRLRSVTVQLFQQAEFHDYAIVR